LKYKCINLPNLLELSFLAVFALPNASNNGFDAKTYYSIVICLLFDPNDSAARYFKIILVDSVLPEPLSPEIIIEHILKADFDASSNN
jgi:hypothetical protein